MSRPRDAAAAAVFLDRDGTIIEDVAYLRDPDQVRLLPGAAAAIRRLNDRDCSPSWSPTNRGSLGACCPGTTTRSPNGAWMSSSRPRGPKLDAHYFCPHLPELTGPCDCRKPGVLLYRQAAEQFEIDLATSWWVGDRVRDVLPAETLAAVAFWCSPVREQPRPEMRRRAGLPSR